MVISGNGCFTTVLLLFLSMLVACLELTSLKQVFCCLFRFLFTKEQVLFFHLKNLSLYIRVGGDRVGDAVL